MEKFTAYEKLSKKKKRQLNAARRKDWGAISPVTRRPENPKAYNRKKTRKRDYENPETASFSLQRSMSQRKLPLTASL